MQPYDAQDRRAYMALGLVLGTIVGLGLGVLVAPRSGEETRGLIRDRAMAAKQKAWQQMAQKREKAMSAMGRVAERSQHASNGEVDDTNDIARSKRSSGRS